MATATRGYIHFRDDFDSLTRRLAAISLHSRVTRHPSLLLLPCRFSLRPLLSTRPSRFRRDIVGCLSKRRHRLPPLHLSRQVPLETAPSLVVKLVEVRVDRFRKCNLSEVFAELLVLLRLRGQPQARLTPLYEPDRALAPAVRHPPAVCQPVSLLCGRFHHDVAGEPALRFWHRRLFILAHHAALRRHAARLGASRGPAAAAVALPLLADTFDGAGHRTKTTRPAPNLASYQT